MDIRKHAGLAAKGREGGDHPVLTVALPLAYDGVGNALRRSFRTSRNDLPDDMLSLLAKLD